MSRVSRRQRIQKLLDAQDGKCAYCGKRCTGIYAGFTDKPPIPQAQRARLANIDHIIPRSVGGKNKPENVVAACVACNEAKGTKPLAQFLKELGLEARYYRLPEIVK